MQFPRWAPLVIATLGSAVYGRDACAQLVVDPRGPMRTITEALATVKPGQTITVRAGTYREPTLVVSTARVTIEGEGWPVLDGESQRAVLIVAADDVTVRGLEVARTGVSNIEDRAGIRVRDAANCRIEHNRLRDNLFGIYLQRSIGCTVTSNDVSAHGDGQSTSGNGIHMWYSPHTTVEHNHIAGHRDGIYFEFSSGGVTRNNTSEHSQRYGLHFMFSDSCHYEFNTFRDNNSGVAVMYSRGITIHHNRFERSLGGAAYGLLLKEILGGEISDNVFTENSTGLYLEGSSHLAVRDNDFLSNGWAAKVLASAMDNQFTGNRFVGNAFDVATNSRSANSTFDRNWWDAYKGYDLDRDGVGDTPFHPVRLFALVVEQHQPTLLLLRSPMVAVLDAAERVFPVLTPEALVDKHPLMRSPR
jgi:nitrous oxidase accessory protein